MEGFSEGRRCARSCIHDRNTSNNADTRHLALARIPTPTPSAYHDPPNGIHSGLKNYTFSATQTG